MNRPLLLHSGLEQCLVQISRLVSWRWHTALIRHFGLLTIASLQKTRKSNSDRMPKFALILDCLSYIMPNLLTLTVWFEAMIVVSEIAPSIILNLK